MDIVIKTPLELGFNARASIDDIFAVAAKMGYFELSAIRQSVLEDNPESLTQCDSGNVYLLGRQKDRQGSEYVGWFEKMNGKLFFESAERGEDRFTLEYLEPQNYVILSTKERTLVEVILDSPQAGKMLRMLLDPGNS